MKPEKTKQVFFSSKTGNTQYLAKILAAAWGVEAQSMGEGAAEGDVIAVGFWTDRGVCDGNTKEFLKTLENKDVFLFGTAGFGGSAAYFEDIINRTAALLPPSARLVGAFCCQGRMGEAVKKRYETLLLEKPGDETVLQMMKNYEAALPHPNVADGAALLLAAEKIEA